MIEAVGGLRALERRPRRASTGSLPERSYASGRSRRRSALEASSVVRGDPEGGVVTNHNTMLALPPGAVYGLFEVRTLHRHDRRGVAAGPAGAVVVVGAIIGQIGRGMQGRAI
jgi:hypothetical protein